MAEERWVAEHPVYPITSVIIISKQKFDKANIYKVESRA